jgi:hypothetical protein
MKNYDDLLFALYRVLDFLRVFPYVNYGTIKRLPISWYLLNGTIDMDDVLSCNDGMVAKRRRRVADKYFFVPV